MFTNWDLPQALSIWAPARLPVRYGGEGAFTPWTAEPCKALYVVGVQGQQMLVCARDEAHLLRRQSSRPSRSQKRR